MQLNPQFYCAYVDYQSAPLNDLARLLQTLESDNVEAGPNEAYLATCQRFELYAFRESFRFPFSLFGALAAHVTIITGTHNVLRRLMAIATGTESLLLGERFIPQQVERAFRHIPRQEQLSELCRKATTSAEQIRKTYNFVAPVDYGEIGYQLLETGGRSSRSKDTVLLIVGSGMLGRALAEHPRAVDYDEIYAVSRWPKQLRKKLTSKAAICTHPETISSLIKNKSFDIIVAVSNVTAEYVSFLQGLILNPNCRSVVDLSTSPIFSQERPTNYVHEYDLSFTQHLSDLSAPLRALLPEVDRALDSIAEVEAHETTT